LDGGSFSVGSFSVPGTLLHVAAVIPDLERLCFFSFPLPKLLDLLLEAFSCTDTISSELLARGLRDCEVFFGFSGGINLGESSRMATGCLNLRFLLLDVEGLGVSLEFLLFPTGVLPLDAELTEVFFFLCKTTLLELFFPVCFLVDCESVFEEELPLGISPPLLRR
jgi:hypothetical protein